MPARRGDGDEEDDPATPGVVHDTVHVWVRLCESEPSNGQPATATIVSCEDGKTVTMARKPGKKPLLKDASETHVLQVMQNFLGYSEYEVVIKSVQPDRSKAHGGALAMRDALLPAMEYRVTYVPTRFTYTQVCVRAFFTFTSCCMLVAYAAEIGRAHV